MPYNTIFVDKNPLVINALRSRFKDSAPECRFVVGDITEQPSGTYVSPANTTGNMDGGLDKLYAELFPHIQSTVYRVIEEQYGGELTIGNAIMLPTHDEKHPYIIFAPTVEHPGISATSDGIFRAARAIFRKAAGNNIKMEKIERPDRLIQTLLVPGIGTGYGNVAPEISAQQVHNGYMAIRNNLHWLRSQIKDTGNIDDFLKNISP
jgi:O-acetyl-ADP-ribose deacetylase (regulator of RNase III)